MEVGGALGSVSPYGSRNQRQISDAEYPIERPSGQTINETSSWHHSFGSDLPHPIDNGIVCRHDDFDVVSAG
jgi:hypothetical protein